MTVIIDGRGGQDRYHGIRLPTYALIQRRASHHDIALTVIRDSEVPGRLDVRVHRLGERANIDFIDFDVACRISHPAARLGPCRGHRRNRRPVWPLPPTVMA